MAVATANKTKKKKSSISDLYVWQGVNKKGDKVSGELRGASPTDVKVQLRSQGVTPSKVKKKQKSLFGASGGSVGAADIAIITRQIATMLSAGVPLVQSIEMIAKGHEKEAMQNLLNGILVELQAGRPFSECLKQHPKYFDDLYVDLVDAGEQSGALDTIYDRIATYKEKAEALKSKIKKAMFYPAAVLAVAFIVTSILLIFVVPQFQEIFEGFGAELPAFTMMVIHISDFMQSYWYVILAALILGGYAFKQAHAKYPSVRDKTDEIIVKLPIIGSILHKAAIARFARTLSTTFAAGVPLISALESAAGASGNAVYRRAIMSIQREVQTGMQMNVAMRMTGIFPDMVTQMVMIGEESGALDGMLAKIANIYEMEVDDAVDGLTALLEPLIMVVLGTLVGGLIIAMYLPIFNMGKIIN
ncbi:type II secretion system F family protein [Corallincola holothuriorum]|uniref:Type II secretion system F family protein n=1 Tax=Corallincola holothuriorum TaxID=2282215 RepID=A0A368NIG3_9GAMM|nr:type II secretion system F family protein [Corallincola holothuriorum]RCU49900.1 type II secretion system F family protein [Corallincola holothuriorum]